MSNPHPVTKIQKGQVLNPNGRPKETIQQKAVRKATKEFILEYKEKLAEALPLISPVLISLASSGDIQAIKEVNDRVMGKSPQSTDITSGGDKVNFNVILTDENSSASDSKSTDEGQSQV